MIKHVLVFFDQKVKDQSRSEVPVIEIQKVFNVNALLCFIFYFSDVGDFKNSEYLFIFIFLFIYLFIYLFILFVYFLLFCFFYLFANLQNQYGEHLG